MCRGTRYIELALAPVRSGVVDANNGRAAVIRIANEQDRAVRIDRAGGAVGLIRAERFPGRGQATWVVAIAAAVIVVGGLEHRVLANNGDHLRDAEHAVAGAIEAVCLAGRLGFDGGYTADQQRCDGCRHTPAGLCQRAGERAATNTR